MYVCIYKDFMVFCQISLPGKAYFGGKPCHGEVFAPKICQEVFDKFAEAAELCAAAADPQQLWPLAQFTGKSRWFTESPGRCFEERVFVAEVVKCVVESCEIALSYCPYCLQCPFPTVLKYQEFAILIQKMSCIIMSIGYDSKRTPFHLR